MLKSALSTLLATELDNASDTDVVSLIEDFIDEAIETIAIRFKWNYLNITKEVTLNSGSNIVSVSNVIDIQKISRKDTEEVIVKATESYLMSLGVDFEDVGFPNWWFISSYDESNAAYVLQFDKVAGDNYNLIVSCKKELGGIASGDSIPFPSQVIPIIKHYVRSLWYLNEENHSVADRFESKFERNLQSFINTYGVISAEFTRSPQNSDLKFVDHSGYDINLDKDRIIEEV